MEIENQDAAVNVVTKQIVITEYQVPFINLLWHVIKILLALILAPILLLPFYVLGRMIFMN